MKNVIKLFGIIAITAMIGFTFASCEGPMGLQGDQGDQGAPGLPPAIVVDINVDTSLDMNRGRSETLSAKVYPYDATVRTLIWELYDAASSEIISLSMASGEPGTVPDTPLPIVSGNSVRVNGLYGGEARILVTALGSGADSVTSVIAVTVNDVGWQIETLRRMEQLPATFRIETVMANEPIRPQLLCFGLEGDQEIEITLTSGTPGGTLHLDGLGSMFTVGAGVTLVLQDVELRGASNNNRALVAVDGGSLYMNAGAKITGNTNISALPHAGGGVRVLPGGRLVMEGGEISGNMAEDEGGGVFNQGHLTMAAGAIRGNISRSFGGGVVNDGTLIMTGGEISGNTSNASGGGVVTWWGGIFSMSAGRIHGNTAINGGGVFVAGGGGFILTGNGEISGNRAAGLDTSNGGGVFVSGGAPGASANGIFEMWGGTVSGNTTTQAGGGVANIANGHFFFFNGEIAGNTALLGGGVFNTGAGWFTMEGSGARISRNTGTAQGGGVDNRGLFWISHGVIHGFGAGEFSNESPVGRTLLTMGAGAQSARVRFDEQGDIIPNTGYVIHPTDSALSATLHVENGAFVPTAGMTVTGIDSGLIGSEGRMFLFSAGNWLPLTGVETTIAVNTAFSWGGAWNIGIGHWSIRLEFWRDGALVATRQGSIPLGSGVTTVPFTDFISPASSAAALGLTSTESLMPALAAEDLPLPERYARFQRRAMSEMLDGPSLRRTFE